jgi:hypothetical protein
MSILGPLDDAFSYLICATAYPKDPVMGLFTVEGVVAGWMVAGASVPG